MITSLNQLDFSKTYSYADYITWQFEELVELLKGKIMPMAAPNVKHQRISTNLVGYFWRYLHGKSCKLFHAPFDVRLIKNPLGKTQKELYTVVQPDLCIICDASKLDEQGCLGAPDLIIEIVSPNNSKRDVQDKFELYQENGVKEYWIVRPYENTVQQFFLENEQYRYIKTYVPKDTISPIILPDLVLELDKIFEE